jgi:hypothetical protein
MRVVLLFLTPMMVAATLPSSPQPTPSGQNFAQQAIASNKNCRSRIEAAGDERGLPKFEQDNAASDKPLMIAAVDRRIDGCEVLVVKDVVVGGKSSEVRPLPEFQDGPGRMQLLH